jgi:hypothetical protein
MESLIEASSEIQLDKKKKSTRKRNKKKWWIWFKSRSKNGTSEHDFIDNVDNEGLDVQTHYWPTSQSFSWTHFVPVLANFSIVLLQCFHTEFMIC